jgi:hypothetical protein
MNQLADADETLLVALMWWMQIQRPCSYRSGLSKTTECDRNEGLNSKARPIGMQPARLSVSARAT